MLLLAGQWPYQRKKERLLRMSLMTITSLSMIVPQVAGSTFYIEKIKLKESVFFKFKYNDNDFYNLYQ